MRLSVAGTIYPVRVSTTHDPGHRPGDLLVRVGGVVFAVGAIATIVTFVPMFLGTEPLPSMAYALSMLMGVGFAVAGAGMLRDMAAQRRSHKAAQETGAAAGPGRSSASSA
ncbi:hypothetical protein GCM10009716_03830 [Streptomyces sodiiphilus]|uniref:Integral membrane protein n=1 Tax=Streptomyces sodiiphilus TaxID=226217 RepID=A0ABP5A3G0_9ACTN